MNNEETFIKSFRNVKLSLDARRRMRAELSAYADFYAVPAAGASLLQQTRFFMNRFSYAVGVCSFLLMGGSIAYAGHISLPGSPLYPVKLAILEPVERVFTIREQTTIDWNIDLAYRRLDEADIVTHVSEPSLKGEAQAAIRVVDAVRTVQKNIDALPSSARAEATVAFNEKLSTHENTLARLALVASTSKATSTASALNKLFTEVHARAERNTSSKDAREPSRQQQKATDEKNKESRSKQQHNVLDNEMIESFFDKDAQE
ncbi:hypothetical protein A3A36_01575 [Candidatus Kaiserbacteria bacterium RIFCSPLOWO2_01_FULL_52_12b]|uniref:DUF5667 domain-containing protein n=1 Tax=Candidatus Kaiserbacteria bacterium RIFCSPLOWO2_01_FULL_52_12b TaxID=1798509 RepID=A0A1F6EXW7_9BACT|nr:MAG: hypothetical protein A3A36_01575 [Candidatus Kaiserbacteria bacterium RIFCSPLOWO2_01_FULL_52_12b]